MTSRQPKPFRKLFHLVCLFNNEGQLARPKRDHQNQGLGFKLYLVAHGIGTGPAGSFASFAILYPHSGWNWSRSVTGIKVTREDGGEREHDQHCAHQCAQQLSEGRFDTRDPTYKRAVLYRAQTRGFVIRCVEWWLVPLRWVNDRVDDQSVWCGNCFLYGLE